MNKAPHNKPTILVVESKIRLSDQIRSMLSNDYRVVYTDSTKDALRFMQENSGKLSLVMVDMHVMENAGLEFIGWIKADVALQRIPVVVITPEKLHEVEYLQIGASDFIRTPSDLPDMVLARIQRSIEASADSAAPEDGNTGVLIDIWDQRTFFSKAEEYDRDHPRSAMDVVSVDISRFHVINEVYGRAVGDRILSKMAEELKRIAERENGLAGREAADVFLLYLPHRDEYLEIMNQLLSELNRINPENNAILLKMGVYPNADKNLDMRSRFDRAKYARDTLHYGSSQIIAYYDGEKHRQNLISQQLMREMDSSLAEHRFKVYYQPKFDITGNKPVPVSAEALVRWHHPEMGVIYPGIFIPLFEDKGMIARLDRYVWEEAAKQMRRWRNKYGFVFPVSVNVSRVDLQDENMADYLIEIMKKYGLDPCDLYIEITETAYTENADLLIRQVNALHAAGFKIEIDDFGSGYSSLNTLSLIHVDAIKLDISFIRDMFGSEKRMKMLELMMLIKDTLQVPIVAEGVEAKEQLDMLRESGCDIVQGYYFSKPVPPEEFEKYVEMKAAAAD